MANSKKVGIITFHNSYNCGSMLQAYALQTILNSKKIDNEIIDFSNDGQRNVYSVFDQRKNIKGFLRNMIIFFYKDSIKNNFDSYEKFKKDNFILSKEIYKKEEELSDKKYKTVITGSDQVWNITIEDGDKAYFLPWVNNAKKVAYAPSFGAKNILKYSQTPDIYKNYLNNFDALSIRENNGQKWIKDLIDKTVPVVLDPTLLLDKTDYDKIETSEIEIPEKYIFYYSPGYNRKINKLVSKISKKYKLPVIAFNKKNFVTKGMMFSNFRLPEIENPSVYLHLIKNATLVITTSFHGTIFSTIYKKRFWTIKNGGMFGDDDRVITLMDNLDLKDRLISMDFDNNFDYLQEKNYKNYERLLHIMRQKSMAYLDENLK